MQKTPGVWKRRGFSLCGKDHNKINCFNDTITV
nr:MAG TPA: hypothetical protein [Caudoviricetes sp.]DAW74382.1 MAG TPA: hypothetical protein [Caudoviricetes sp.]